MTECKMSKVWLVDKDGNRTEMAAVDTDSVGKTVKLEPKTADIPPIDLSNTEWPVFKAEVKMSAEDFEKVFPRVKPQWVLKVGNQDFNLLTDDQKAEAIGKPLNIVANGKVLARWRVIGIHENGGLLLEEREDETE